MITRAIVVGLVCVSMLFGSAQGQIGEALPTPPLEMGPPAPGSEATPTLKLTPESWDFGTKLSGEPAEFEVTIENVGKAPLQFSIRSSCGCTAVAALTQATRIDSSEYQYQLEPGKSDKMKINYNTKKNAKVVSQTITITSNDPDQPSIAFKVSGSIQQLFDMTNEQGHNQDRIIFTGIDRKSTATRTLTLKNMTSEPVRLKLRETATTSYAIKLEETEPGKVYALTATIKPPLELGMNAVDVMLDTDLKTMPEIRVPITTYIQPRVTLTRPNLMVPYGSTSEIRQTVQLRYQKTEPLHVVGFESTVPSVRAEVLPEPHGAVLAGTMATIEIEVTMPPAADLPQEGAVLTILTDDLDPDYQRFPVRITVVNRAPQRPVRATPGASPGVQPVAIEPPRSAEE